MRKFNRSFAMLATLFVVGMSASTVSEAHAFSFKLPKVSLPTFKLPKPQGVPEIILPVCWGSPQDCRKSSHPQRRSTPTPMPVTRYFAALRAQCYEWNGTYRGDTTVTSSSTISYTHAQQGAINYYNTNFSTLCSNIHPNTSVRGNPVWVG